MEITTEEQLRAIVGHPIEMVVKKVKSALEPVHVEWLAASPVLFAATSDEQGRMDVSPKGDPPGKVVHVLDEHTIVIPERPGNKRVDGYLNILRNPHVGTIAIIPGRGDTLRVNGTARIVDGADDDSGGTYFDELAVKGRRPILALEITVEEVFFHCAKAFLRSDLWRPETWHPDDLPSTAQMTKKLMPELDEVALQERYAESNYRKLLY
ncbi:pyridoxamine 5'-phosphate oxidase family protein [Gordonia polyisoprenivorans]|uniref:MSMEG_1061 family FMN-dependent PPOX-type flavoprotein n=1 Tax=Gordonia polyisoprenivorans TaxID=84595 RepID=UPI001A029809|nr:pyridoxamine 5'-phosphate oxidase family protein [Gordonia polyisoprenivorans]UZF54738.1 pyridoxamine 5'-phosphate oxidase family protein [Gordonia polyisoprenivorans]